MLQHGHSGWKHYTFRRCTLIMLIDSGKQADNMGSCATANTVKRSQQRSMNAKTRSCTLRLQTNVSIITYIIPGMISWNTSASKQQICSSRQQHCSTSPERCWSCIVQLQSTGSSINPTSSSAEQLTGPSTACTACFLLLSKRQQKPAARPSSHPPVARSSSWTIGQLQTSELLFG